MEHPTCKVEWCGRQPRALGFCLAHYKRHRAGRDMDAPLKGVPRKCKVPSCQNDALAKGYCNAHYLRFAKGSDMNRAVRKREKDRVCTAPGCGRKHMGQGFCSSHYRQHMRLRFWRELLNRRGDRCSVCGKRYPIAVYDLHHRDPKSKEFAVSNAIGNRSLETLLAEADKCDLVCANCHRIMHAKGWAARLFSE